MGEKRGLWICIDGPDYTGKRNQCARLADKLTLLHEDNDVLITHEPTRRAQEIKRKLREDPDAYSDGLKLAALYVDDRVLHESLIIDPVLGAGGIVISNRHKYSTDAYQSAQGVLLDDLVDLQKRKGVGTPEITLLLDIDINTIRKRMQTRTGRPKVSLDKFERDLDFQSKVADQYRKIAELASTDSGYFGKVILINSDGTYEMVAERVFKAVSPVYDEWAESQQNP